MLEINAAPRIRTFGVTVEWQADYPNQKLIVTIVNFIGWILKKDPVKTRSVVCPPTPRATSVIHVVGSPKWTAQI